MPVHVPFMRLYSALPLPPPRCSVLHCLCAPHFPSRLEASLFALPARRFSPSRLFFVLPGSRPSLFRPSFLPLLAVPPGGGAHTTGGLLRFSAAPPRPRFLPSLSLLVFLLPPYIQHTALVGPRTEFCTCTLVGFFLPKSFLPTPALGEASRNYCPAPPFVQAQGGRFC